MAKSMDSVKHAAPAGSIPVGSSAVSRAVSESDITPFMMISTLEFGRVIL